MTPQAIHDRLKAKFGEAILALDANPLEPSIKVDPASLLEIARYLKEDAGLAIDTCMNLTAIDTPKNFVVVYNLYSIQHQHRCTLRAELPRENPHLPSVASVWRGADWHEREAFDLMGITFDGHPELRRILLPDDWVGHPLRKDYVFPDAYHDIPLK